MGYRRKYSKRDGSSYHSIYHQTRGGFDRVYIKFRKEVRRRDKVCQFPNCKAKKPLQVHHIIKWADAPYLRYEPRNGILLCKYHHELVCGQEEHYIELFSNIVARKYDNNNRQ